MDRRHGNRDDVSPMVLQSRCESFVVVSAARRRCSLIGRCRRRTTATFTADTQVLYSFSSPRPRPSSPFRSSSSPRSSFEDPVPHCRAPMGSIDASRGIQAADPSDPSPQARKKLANERGLGHATVPDVIRGRAGLASGNSLRAEGLGLHGLPHRWFERQTKPPVDNTRVIAAAGIRTCPCSKLWEVALVGYQVGEYGTSLPHHNC